jgi:hypothetical protein
VELDLDSPTLFHGVVLNYAQGQPLPSQLNLKTQKAKIAEVIKTL